ncbi:MAG TPA: head GIN domain-containing protein, partial [Flavobacterium sp.]|nr:head GIN domain-containing protein [Flavobacterium sp.]
KTTAEYDGIDTEDFFDVELVSGKEGNIKIKGEENLLDLIHVEVNNNILEISIDQKKQSELRNNKDIFIIEPTKKIVVTVPFDKISTIESSGSGDIYTQNKISGSSLELELSGSGNMKIDTDAAKVTASLSGSAGIILSGKTGILDLDVSGTGYIDSENLLARNAEAEVSGRGNIKVNCTGKLSATVSGKGNIQYKGKPASVDKEVNNWGSITSY